MSVTVIILIVVAAWLLCAVLSAGFDLAYFQGAFPNLAANSYRTNLGMALLFGIAGGPVALLVSLFAGGFAEHGWRLTRKRK